MSDNPPIWELQRQINELRLTVAGLQSIADAERIDMWQDATVPAGQRPDDLAPPEGYVPVGPWKPYAASTVNASVERPYECGMAYYTEAVPARCWERPLRVAS